MAYTNEYSAGSKILQNSISVRLIEGAGEQVEIFKTRRVIRITATKDRAAIIAEEIRKFLRSMHRIEVDLSALVETKPSHTNKIKTNNLGQYNALAMEDLARITETNITRLSNDKVDSTQSQNLHFTDHLCRSPLQA